MDKVAVVILNWNGRDMLHRFLPGILACSKAQVYVADNASTDDSLHMLQQEFPSVPVIVLDRNYGFAEGYNKALRQVDAEYYVLLNSDVEVAEGWVEPMVEYLDAHPQVAACQPKLLDWNRRSLFEYAGASGGYIDRWGYPYCRGRLFDTIEADYGQYDDVVPVFWATGAALMVRAKVYHELGGLDGRFFAHMEEIDFCWRIHLRGYDIVCVPQSEVYHIGGGTLPKENPRKAYLNFRNNLYMLYKNLPRQRLKKVMFIRFWLDVLAALQFLLKGEVNTFRMVFKAHRDFRSAKGWLKTARMDNMRHAVCVQPREISSFSLLWQYYVLRHKKYDELMK